MDEKELLKELIDHINNGGKAIVKIAEFKKKYPDVDNAFWKKLRKDATSATQGTHEAQYAKVKEKARKEAVTLVNDILKNATFAGKSIGSRGINRLSEILNKLHLLKPAGDIDSEALNNLLRLAETQLRAADMLKEYSQLERIVDKLSEEQFMGKDEEEHRLINMALNEFYIEFGQYNYMDADDRKAMYIFWEKVQDEYPKLVKAVEDLKEKLQKLRPDDANFQKLVNDLEAPPPYILHIGTVKVRFKDPLQRFIAFLERLGAKKPRGGKTTYSRQTIRGKEGSKIVEDKLVGEARPELSQRLPESHSSARSDRVLELTRDGLEYSDEVIPLDTGMKEIELDPVLWEIWDDLEVPAGFGDDLEDMLEQLSKLDALTGEDKRLADLVTEELKNAVKDIQDGVIYLPIAHWLKELVPGIVDEIGDVNDKTGKFFSVLNRLFLESGMFNVYMGTKFGGPQRGAAGSAIEISGKTDAQQFRRPRIQGTMDTLPEEKTDEYIEAVDEEWKELQKLLNNYYFHPINKGDFVNDEKPDFSDLGGTDYDAVEEGEEEPEVGEFDPDRTTQEGKYPYRALEFNFGTHPMANIVRRMLAALDDDMFDPDVLESLVELIQMLKGGFESVQGWERYRKNIEEHITLTLDKLLPDHKHENRVWAAGKIGDALTNAQEEPLISEMKLFGKPIDDLYKEYVSWNDGDLPLTHIRALLLSPEFENMMREDADWSEKEDYDEVVGFVKKVLQLTEPKEEVSAKDEVDESTTALNKALLKVHDYINKMNSLPIYYGQLDINDIDDMDYLINKIEKEDKVEVNSVEVALIVNSIDSYYNISKSFGFRESVVYKIKGLCR